MISFVFLVFFFGFFFSCTFLMENLLTKSTTKHTQGERGRNNDNDDDGLLRMRGEVFSSAGDDRTGWAGVC